MTLGDWLWAIPVFGILIFIHEFGHFSVAKFFGIRVHEFALGFGPMVAGFDLGETRYNLRAVPLGGFCRMAGMEEGDSDDPRGFNRKPLYARALVIAAGPIMNFVLAALLYTAFQMVVGQPSQEPIIGDIPAQCQAVQAGATANVPCPAYSMGLKKGDRVLAVNGQAISAWDDILNAVKGSDGKPLAFHIQRGKETRDLTVQPIFDEGRWMVGIMAGKKPVPVLQALAQGPVMTAKISGMWAAGLVDMIVGRVKPQFSGPVGITREIAETASQGWDSLLLLTAFLSINLGMFNLLPIPALDGSRLVFMGVEAARGRRMDPQRENMVHFVGFLILIGLMVVITYGEIVRR